MNATNEVYDALLFGAVGALMGLLFGVAAYVGTMTLWHIAVAWRAAWSSAWCRAFARRKTKGEEMNLNNLSAILWTAVIAVSLAGLFFGIELGIRAGSGFLGGLLGLVLGFAAGVLGARWSVERWR